MGFDLPSFGGVPATQGSAAVAVCVIASLAMLVVFVAWLVYRLRSSYLQRVTLFREATDLNSSLVPLLADDRAAPNTANGQPFGYSFWVYLRAIEPSTEHKLLLTRSPQMGGVALTTGQLLEYSNPVVFLDKGTNRVYISVPTTAMAGMPQLDDLARADGTSAVTAVINYLPLRRWVHVMFTVQDNVLSTYVDGDVYAVYSIKEAAAAARPLFRGTSGAAQLGAAGAGKARAHVSRVEFFNYCPTADEAARVYSRGPSAATWLSRVGLPPYGIRSPVYRLD